MLTVCRSDGAIRDISEKSFWQDTKGTAGGGFQMLDNVKLELIRTRGPTRPEPDEEALTSLTF